jgi:hypothetical protein
MVNGIKKANGEILDYGTGMGKAAVVRGLSGLQEKGIIVAKRNQSRERGYEPTNYTLRFKGEPLSPKDTRGGILKRQGLVSLGDIQVTVEQETVIQETEYSNSFELLTQKSKKASTFEKSKKHDKIDRTVSQAIAEPQPERKSSGGMKKVGELLERYTTAQSAANGSQPPSQPRRRGRPSQYQATAAIEAMVTQWTEELNDDPEHARSNVTQAARLWHESGASEDTFRDLLYEARRRSKGAGNVEKLADGEAGKLGFRNRAPYFFACLKKIIREDLQRQVDDRAPRTGKGKSSSTKGDRTTNVGYG